MESNHAELRRAPTAKWTSSLALAALLGASVALGACTNNPFDQSGIGPEDAPTADPATLDEATPRVTDPAGPGDLPSEMPGEAIDESRGGSSSQ